MRALSAQLAAVKAALKATGRVLFTYSEIEAIPEPKRPPAYIVFDVSRMYGGAETSDGTTGASMWRIGTRAVADDSDNANVLLDDCTAALEGQVLVVNEEPTGPIEFETSVPTGPDAGKYSGSIDWTYDHS